MLCGTAVARPGLPTVRPESLPIKCKDADKHCYPLALWTKVKMSPEQAQSKDRWSRLRTATGQRWLLWAGTFVIVAVSGAVLLRVLRQYPEGVHSYLNSAPPALRWGATCLASLGFTLLLIRLLNPRLKHAQYLLTYPSGWTAWAVAAVVVALVDIFCGLGSEVYQGEWWEWLLYGGGSCAAVAFYRKLTAVKTEATHPDDTATGEVKVEDVAAPVSLTELAENWALLKKWLTDDKPAEDDLIGNRRVALRLARFLVSKGGTVGLVGPYGSGKTSIIAWLKQYAKKIHKREYPKNPELWFCSVSCWGFEDSAAAISQILGKAVAAVGEEVDCFSVRHLPESYRKTFSAGGDWVRTLFDLVVGTSDPLAQFQSLSGILKAVNARLVVVVEDLDRTSSSRFDRKEIAALLFRLKETDNVSFILAAGQSSSGDLDFSKICENIELVKEFEPEEIAAIIQAVRRHCLRDFKHVPTSSSESPWNRVASWFSAARDDIALGEAAARLLRTPRSIKQALAHTYRAWEKTYGEIDFDHLFATNILRHSAPEAFDFLLCRWTQLNNDPKNWGDDRKKLPEIQKRYQEEWERATKNVEWSPRAALGIIEFLLPTSSEYLQSRTAFSNRTIQGVATKRYWERAVSQHVDATQVRDQAVIADMQEWQATKDPAGKLLTGIIEGGDYVQVFDYFAPDFFRGLPQESLQLGNQVLVTLRTRYGATASEVYTRDGFDVVRRLFSNVVPPESPAGRYWLENQIRLSVPVSLMLTSDLLGTWAVPSSLLTLPEERDELYRLTESLARESCSTGKSLLKVLHPTMHYDVARFVRRLVHAEHGTPPFTLDQLAWFGNALVDALAVNSKCVAPKIAYLLSEQLRGPDHAGWIHQFKVGRLFPLFGSNSRAVLEALKSYAEIAEGNEKVIMGQIVATGWSEFNAEVERCLCDGSGVPQPR